MILAGGAGSVDCTDGVANFILLLWVGEGSVDPPVDHAGLDGGRVS